ncbi:MAG TPA: hypothetical protein GX716_10915 [Firmicutes bacterium]|nr:hypothetical protein [Candidatus Fermentithermobacillaceae bacterium]
MSKQGSKPGADKVHRAGHGAGKANCAGPDAEEKIRRPRERFLPAIEYVRRYGNEREKEALRLLFEPGPPSPTVVRELFSGELPQGGWTYPGCEIGSVNETLWRITQALEIGLDAGHPAMMSALSFLLRVQNADGSWVEDARLASKCPPWAAPGRPATTLYLTSSAAYVVAILMGTSLPETRRASNCLSAMLESEGRLPSYLHTHWLAAGLWWKTGERDLVDRVIGYLRSRLGPDTPTNHLSWAAVTLLDAGLPSENPFVQLLLDLLEARQSEDGHFDAEDGEAWFAHSTWEALKAFAMEGRLFEATSQA